MMSTLPTLILAGLFASFTLALTYAMAKRPNPTDLTPKPISRVMLIVVGWASAAILGFCALILYGLFTPILLAAILIAIYLVARSQNLTPLYRFAPAVAALSLISAIFLAAQVISILSDITQNFSMRKLP